MSSSIQKVRSNIIIAVTLGLYIWLCYLLGQADLFVVSHTFLWCVVQVGICIMLLPLLSIELQHIKTKYLVRGVLALMFVNLLIQGGPVWTNSLSDAEALQLIFRLGSLFVFHIGLAIFVRYKDLVLTTRRIFSPIILFLSGVNVFAIFVAGTFAMLIGGSYDKISLSCDELMPRVEQIFQSKSGHIQKYINKIDNSKVDIGNILEGMESVDGYETIANLGDLDIKQGSLIDEIKSQFGEYENIISKQVLGTKTEIDNQYCDMIVEQIEDSSKTGGFRLSAVVLLFVLLSPVVALILNILLSIASMAFQVLIRLKIYSREERDMKGRGIA